MTRFLALHLQDPWRVPVAIAFTLVGVVMIYFGTVIPNRHDRATREQQAVPSDQTPSPVG